MYNTTLNVQDQTGSDKQPVNVTAYCAAYELDLVELYGTLTERFGLNSVTEYPEGSMKDVNLTADRTPDMLHVTYRDLNGHASGDVIAFEVCKRLIAVMICSINVPLPHIAMYPIYSKFPTSLTRNFLQV